MAKKTFFGMLGIMNVITFLLYAFVLIPLFIIMFKPSFMYEYPSAKTKPNCSYQYCFEESCSEINDQDLKYSITTGMRQLNVLYLVITYAVMLAICIILHIAIAKFGLLNIGTDNGVCGFNYIACK